MTLGYPIYFIMKIFNKENFSSDSWNRMNSVYTEYSEKFKKNINDLNGKINAKTKNKKKRTTIWGRTWKTLKRVITGR